MLADSSPLALASVVLRRGMGVRSIHAIHAANCPRRPAIVDQHRTIDYGQLDAEIDALARALVRDGVRKGQPVGLLMENRSEYVVAWMALTRLGIASAHLGTSSTGAELQPLIERTGIVRVFVSASTRERAAKLAADHPQLGLRLIDVDPPATERSPACASYHAWVQAHRSGDAVTPLSREAGSAASVVYTSGTTGRPKGAVRDLQSVGAMELLRIVERLPVRAGDRHLVVAPLYHSGAQAFTLIMSSLASTLVLVDRFDAPKVAQLMADEQIESTFMVPTMLRRLLDLPKETLKRCPTPHLRAIVSGAAPFSVGLRRRAIAHYGAKTIFDFYGATELGWVTLASGYDMISRPGTLGRALAGQQIKIVDESGRSLPSGQVGKIYTRSAQHMHGYLNDAAATEEVSDAGWATVDDLGYLDEDGHLFLTGRARDMVISGGVNVYPVEIENVLSQHPTVRDVAVIGLPDPQWGERVTAVIVPGENFHEELIDAWVRTRLAKAKWPRQWVVVDALPRNPTGKVLKRQLVERLGDPTPVGGPATS